MELCAGLEKINKEAFSSCKSLEYIIIPSSVKKVCYAAFRSCTRLRKVEFCEGMGVSGISNVFEGCTSLESISIPSSVTIIGLCAFSRCTKLRQVELHVGLEEIGYGAFEGCVSLERIVVPSSVETIVQRAFYGCEHLVNVSLFEGLKRIDYDAFAGCKALERINIPASVKDIELGVFGNCPSLVAIEFCSEIEDLVAASSLTDWYNHGRNERWLKVYSCLKQLGILDRLTRIQHQRKWRNAIYDLLGRYPLVHRDKLLSFSSHICRVLDDYINLKDSASILELALWKSRIEGIDDGFAWIIAEGY